MHNSPIDHYLTQLCQPDVFFYSHVTNFQAEPAEPAAPEGASQKQKSVRDRVHLHKAQAYFLEAILQRAQNDSRSFAVQSHRTCSAFPVISYTAFSPAKVELSRVLILLLSPLSYTHANLHTQCDPVALILNGSVG